MVTDASFGYPVFREGRTRKKRFARWVANRFFTEFLPNRGPKSKESHLLGGLIFPFISRNDILHLIEQPIAFTLIFQCGGQAPGMGRDAGILLAEGFAIPCREPGE